MAAPNFDAERAARVLVDACFMTDAEAAERHDLSRRTVLNYRKRLASDAELAQLFTAKLQEARAHEGWADDLTSTIRTAMSAVRRCANEMDPTKPSTLQALTDALRVLTEAQLALRVIDARLAQQDRQPEPAPGEGAAFGSARGFA